MKTTVKRLKRLIKEAVTMGPADLEFWSNVEANNKLVGWDEAQGHMPPEVAAAFEEKLINEEGYEPDDFEFAYEPITYFKDKYPEEEPAEDDPEESGEPFLTAYCAVNDELWHWNGSAWMLYNY